MLNNYYMHRSMGANSQKIHTLAPNINDISCCENDTSTQFETMIGTGQPEKSF